MSALSVVKRYLEYFNQNDRKGMVSLLHPEICHEVNQGETRIGLEAFEAFMKHMDDCYSEQLVNMVFFSDETGNRAACEFTVQGTYLKTDGDLPAAHGQKYTLPAGSFFEVKRGKITRITTYYNLPLWINIIKNG